MEIRTYIIPALPPVLSPKGYLFKYFKVDRELKKKKKL